MDEPDLSSIMIDATYAKCRTHSSGARGGNVHDSQRAEELNKDFKAKYLIADKGYYS